MADRVVLYDVTDDEYRRFKTALGSLGVIERILRKQYRFPLRHTRSFDVSNYLISTDDSIAMFGKLLSKAIHGGSIISDYFWHPMFPPRFHDARTVNELFDAISAVWDGLRSDNHTLCTDAFWSFEISHLLDAYGYAAGLNSGLVVVTPAYFGGGREVKTKYPRMTRTSSALNDPS